MAKAAHGGAASFHLSESHAARRGARHELWHAGAVRWAITLDVTWATTVVANHFDARPVVGVDNTS
eukprot:2032772-Prymnesium_polylepis.1